jgi:hypothetical protein
MGDEMIIGLGEFARGHIDDGACASVRTYRRGGVRLRYFLAFWLVVSSIWISAAIYNIYQRVDQQADMSMDVERDLDQGLSTASCTGRCITATQATPASNRFDIASTYLRFGSIEMAECVLGPPVALLLVGLGAFSVLRRKRVMV